MNPLREITSTRLLLDGHEFLMLSADEALELECPSDSHPIYFFRANGKTVAVVRKYHACRSRSHEGELVIELTSDDLVRVEPSSVIAICGMCGWRRGFSSQRDAPSACPTCSSNLFVRN